MKKLVVAAACIAMAGSSFATINAPDALDVGDGNNDITMVSTAQLDSEFGTVGGIGDTFTGSIQFEFTIGVQNFSQSTHWGGLELYSATAEVLGTGGNWQWGAWSTFGGSVGGNVINISGPVDGWVNISDVNTETFNLKIDYVAGGADTATYTMNGYTTVFNGDFSFDHLVARGGNGTTENRHDITGLTVAEVVPEPASLSLLAVLGGCMLFARRKFRI